MEELAILATYKEVEPHLDAVRRASDSNRIALGFLPSTVFPEYARREKLLVATAGGKAACVFDNIVHFEHPVGLAYLRGIGISEARLITANRVSDHQLAAILEAGFGHGIQ